MSKMETRWDSQLFFTMNANGKRPATEQRGEQDWCCICLGNDKDLPVTSCCGKMVHESCIKYAISNLPHCPHCRETMETVILCLFVLTFFLLFMLIRMAMNGTEVYRSMQYYSDFDYGWGFPKQENDD